MLTDAACKPAFEDVFDSHVCAVRGIEWLKLVYQAYDNYLKPAGKGEDLTEDELRDPILQDDDETDKEFEIRKKQHLEELDEITPEINPEEDRIEDHL
jgi:hypothetical protein